MKLKKESTPGKVRHSFLDYPEGLKLPENANISTTQAVGERSAEEATQKPKSQHNKKRAGGKQNVKKETRKNPGGREGRDAEKSKNVTGARSTTSQANRAPEKREKVRRKKLGRPH